MTGSNRLALVGQNIAYSKSPAVFSAIFDEIGVAGRCDLVNCEESALPDMIDRLRGGDYAGCAVTIPYKRVIIAFLDRVDKAARAIDAVNCVRVESNRRLTGYNTDCYGFGLPLVGMRTELAVGRVVILGAGGSARAVAFSLATAFKVREFVIVARSAESLSEFRQWLLAAAPSVRVDTALLDSLAGACADDVALLVNCTPRGGYNDPGGTPFDPRFDWAHVKAYYDLNYNPGNEVVNVARRAIKRALDGSVMLVGQAVRSFEIWTGKSVAWERIYPRVF